MHNPSVGRTGQTLEHDRDHEPPHSSAQRAGGAQPRVKPWDLWIPPALQAAPPRSAPGANTSDRSIFTAARNAAGWSFMTTNLACLNVDEVNAMTQLWSRLVSRTHRLDQLNITVYTRAVLLLPQGTRRAQGRAAAVRVLDSGDRYRR